MTVEDSYLVSLRKYHMDTKALLAPKAYFKLSEKQKGLLNGCGPEFFLALPGAHWLIENVMQGCSFFAECCRIHDYQYSYEQGEHVGTPEHRAKADQAFLFNMQLKIRGLTPWWKRALRTAQAHAYFAMVDNFGEFFYSYGARVSLDEVEG